MGTHPEYDFHMGDKGAQNVWQNYYLVFGRILDSSGCFIHSLLILTEELCLRFSLLAEYETTTKAGGRNIILFDLGIGVGTR